MSDRFGGWFPLALLAVVAALTFWLDRVVQPQASVRVDAANHDPDYIVDGLSATRMDPEGRVKHTLRARRMTHFPEDDITLLADPRFVTYSEGRPPVSITSRRARVSGDGEDVYFEDQVRVVRPSLGQQSELTVETNYLHVIPDVNVAKTNRPVTIRSEGGVITASGLELNSETRVLNLHGRVRSTFDSTAASRNAR